VKLLRFPVLLATLVLALGQAGANTDTGFRTTNLMRLETRTLVQMLEAFHYNKGAVTPTDYPQLITDYMEELDPQRLFFTAQDEHNFRSRFGPKLETDLNYLGNIDPAFEIFTAYNKRVQERVGWLFAELGKDHDFTGAEAYNTDRTRSPWPADAAEADGLWRRRLKYELLQEIVGRTKAPADAAKTVHKRYERMLKNVSDIEPNDVQELYLSSLTKMYDPHSAYFNADTLEDFSIQMRLSLFGIGAILSVDEEGYCVIREIVHGGPADLGGQLKVKDKITAVTQPGAEPVEIIGMKLRRIVDMIRGAKGTKVELTVLSADETDSTKTRSVVITRDEIKLNSARASAAIHELPSEAGVVTPIGVITLNSFYGASGDGDEDGFKGTASKDVAELVGKLKQAGIKALVVDLRRNGGGLLSEAIEMTGLFIEQGPVVQVRDSLGRLQVDSDSDRGIAYDGPLAVLTSRFSASASEIFAGALQNYGRALIVGDSSTHGKGTVQAVLEMKNYLRNPPPRTGAAKLTLQKYYLPNGASTQRKGVVPDIALPSIDDYLPVDREADLPHALMWDEIKSAPFTGKPLPASVVQPLLAASLERQGQLDEFHYLNRNIDWFKQRQAMKSVSLNLEARKTDKQTADEFRKAQDAERERLARQNFAKRDVKLDSVTQADSAKKDAVAQLSDEGDTDAEAPDAKAAQLDIHLREAMRILSDAIKLSQDPKFTAFGYAPLTAGAQKS
jgi:carboxyl-terminal processing protease